MSAAVALGAGCRGGDPAATGPSPPDSLTVTRETPSGGGFAVTLDCTVADRGACAEVLEAVADAAQRESCVPLAGGDARLVLDGVIGGEPIRQIVGRRTDCEAEAYDRVVAALGP